jgi:hypothetical protein
LSWAREAEVFVFLGRSATFSALIHSKLGNWHVTHLRDGAIVTIHLNAFLVCLNVHRLFLNQVNSARAKPSKPIRPRSVRTITMPRVASMAIIISLSGVTVSIRPALVMTVFQILLIPAPTFRAHVIPSWTVWALQAEVFEFSGRSAPGSALIHSSLGNWYVFLVREGAIVTISINA